MGNKVKKIYMRRRGPRLPSEYQEVEYIQSSGTQYIDTGYNPNNNTEVSAKFSLTSLNNSYVYGVRNNQSDASRRAFFMGYDTSLQKFYAQVLNNRNNNEILSLSSPSLNTEYTTLQNNKAFYINGELQGNYNNQSTFSVGYNMFVFGGKIGDSVGNKMPMKLYYMKISENGTLVRDFIPCYRKSDNVIGLYDLVNDQFYTNAGSGTFTKGTDSSTLELKEFQVWPDEGGTLSGYRDFTTATKSALEGEGWGGQGGGSWSVSSSGLTTSRSTTDRSYMISLPIQINTEAKSIRIYGVVNRSVGSWYGNFKWGIKATNTCGSGRDDYPTGDWLITQSMNCNDNSGYMGYGAGTDVLGFTGPGQGNTSNLGYSGSDITVETIIDLDGGTCSCSYKSGSTTIWSGSTTFDSATVKATLSGLSINQYLSIFNRNGTSNGKYMKNFGYEVIY